MPAEAADAKITPDLLLVAAQGHRDTAECDVGDAAPSAAAKKSASIHSRSLASSAREGWRPVRRYQATVRKPGLAPASIDGARCRPAGYAYRAVIVDFRLSREARWAASVPSAAASITSSRTRAKRRRPECLRSRRGSRGVLEPVVRSPVLFGKESDALRLASRPPRIRPSQLLR
jgi:hypothetical protein